MVTRMSACRSRSATALIDTPDWTSHAAQQWRRSWIRKSSIPAFKHAVANDRFTEAIRSPSLCAKTHEVVEQPYHPVYQRVMGEQFNALPTVVRSIHNVVGDDGATGRAVVVRGQTWAAKLICNIMRFPPEGESESHVAFSENDGIERWERDFGGNCFSSELRQVGTLLEERFGPLRFYFDLRSTDVGLEMVMRKWSALSIPLPLAIAPRSRAVESASGNKFEFDVSIALPLIGTLVRYKGDLEKPK